MIEPSARRARTSGGFTKGLRRVGAFLALAMVVAIVPVAAEHIAAATGPVIQAPASTKDSPARLPDLTRTGNVGPLLLAARPVRQRHPGPGLMLLAAVALFCAFRRRSDLGARAYSRSDAIFARRRGPPYLQTAL